MNWETGVMGPNPIIIAINVLDKGCSGWNHPCENSLLESVHGQALKETGTQCSSYNQKNKGQ